MHAAVLGLLGIHILFGTLAVIFAPVALLTRKGERAHRKSGMLFVRAMTVVLISAALLAAIKHNPYFAALTVSATILVFSGFRVLRRKRPDLDPRQRATALDWGLTVVLLIGGLALAAMAMHGDIRSNRGFVYALASPTILWSGWDLFRFMTPERIPFTVHLWLYEHLIKMTAAFFAALAAFSGSVLVLFPPPWRQLWAVIAGEVLTVTLVLLWRHRIRNGHRVARFTPVPSPAAGD